MLLLGEGSEATEPYNEYDKNRPHSIRSLQFDQKVRPLSFRPEKFDLFTATLRTYSTSSHSNLVNQTYARSPRYENSNLVSRNYSIRTYCTSSNSNLVDRTYCPKPTEAEARKIEKYRESIDNGYIFQPMALRGHGSLGESSEIFITRLCKMLCRSHDNQQAGSF